MRRIACCLLLLVVVVSASSSPASATSANAWTMSGPSTAFIAAIAGSPSSAGHIYAGDQNGGLWRTADNGATWADISPGDSSTAGSPVEGIAVSPTDQNVVIATRGCRLYASGDGGDTWQTPSGIATPPYCYNGFPVVFDPNGTAWACVWGGLYSSSDGGLTWTLAGSPPNTPGAGGLAVAPGNPEVIWVGSTTGTISTTSDGGATWQDHSQGLPTQQGGIQTLLLDPGQPTTAYVLLAGNAYRTTGGSWIQVFGELDQYGSGIYSLTISPGSPETIVVGSDMGVHRSNNGGQTWSAVSGGPHAWFSSTEAMAVDPASPSDVWAGGAGLFHSTDTGTSFAFLPAAIGRGIIPVLVGDPSNAQRLYVGTDSNGLLRSDDGGTTWQQLGEGVFGQVRGVAVDPFTPGILLAAAGNYVYRSTDSGTTWTALVGAVPGVNNAVAADPAAPGVFYANGTSFIYRSSDHGASWTACGATSSSPTYAIRSIAVDPSNDAIVYAVGGAGIWRSTDSCAHWTALGAQYAYQVSVGPDGTAYVATGEQAAVAFAPGSNTPVPATTSTGFDAPLTAYAITADLQHAGVAYAGTAHGTYQTVDGGHRWSKLTTNGLPDVWSLSILVDGNTLTTGTRQGIATIHLNGPSASTGDSQIQGTTVTFNGTANPAGQSAKAFFEYGATTAYGQSTPQTDIGSGTGDVAASAQITGTLNTSYHYRLVVTTGDGIAVGADQTATIPPLPPTASLSATTGIGLYGATLRGSVNPSSAATSYHFEWGTTTAYGSASNGQQLNASSSPTTVGSVLNGLTPGTTYHYRLVATNSGGTATTSDATFQTTALTPPQAMLTSPTLVRLTTATLNGIVTPGNTETTWHFEWGETTSYGAASPDMSFAPSGLRADVWRDLTGLSPDTTYHYRLVASDSYGTTTTGDATFHTPLHLAPTVTVGTPTGISINAATLNASVDPGDTDTSYHFEWGLTGNYGASTAPAEVAGNARDTAVSARLTELIPGTLYHYRIVATNSGGTMDSTGVFQTADRPPTMLWAGPGHLIRGQLDQGAIPVSLYWSAQPGDSLICGYDVNRLAPAPGITLGSPVNARFTDFAVPGALRYDLRATGCDTLQSDWLATARQTLDLIQQGSSDIHYHGSWRTVAAERASGGSIRRTTTAGSSLTYTFTGRDAALVAPSCSKCSGVEISLDGGSAKKISLHAPSLTPRAIHVLAHFATDRRHTVTITAVARDGKTRVDVDGLIRLT